jgi:type VI secretion system protein ImpC
MTPPNEQTESSAQGGTLEAGSLDSLLEKSFKPKSDSQKSAIKSAVNTLAATALKNASLISDDAVKSIEGMVAELDKRLSSQLNVVMHNEAFQKLESAWRGLSFLVNNSETDETLKIKVMNISKKDLTKELKKYKGTAWDQSPFFKAIYENEFGTPGGEPYGTLIGDYYFDQSPPDVELMKQIAQVAAAAQAPFIAASDPSILGMDSWQELANPRDLTKLMSTPDYAAWQSFRKSEDSRYMALTMPRVLSRLPYGETTNPIDEFNYEEDTDQGNSNDYTWMNAAYAMGANINRSFKEYGWTTAIRGVENGGMVENLPTHTFPTDDGGMAMKCPTEVAITDRREAELAKNGFLPLVHWKNTDYAVFIGGQTLNEPAEYQDPDATANAKLAARLPYIFAVSRFSHYLKCIVRDKVGSFMGRAEMQEWLQNWIAQYVTTDPTASDEVKAKYPLAAAEVLVQEVEGDPGYYNARFELRPHYQLEGLTASMRLVTKLPSEKSGGS